MKENKNIQLFEKVIVSLAIAFLVLNILSFFYYKIPVHNTNDDGSTDYVWDKNSLYIRTDEGIGFGKTNNEGYMNINDYDGDVDILLMGSSHMEAQNVPIEKNVASLLNKSIPELETYNIGVSGHSLKVIFNNLDDALNKYKPKYAVLEISNLLLSDDYINNVLSGNVDEIESSSNKIVIFLQRFPFLRLVYSQIDKFNSGEEYSVNDYSEETIDYEPNYDLMNELVKYAKNIGDKYNAKLIIMYHPPLSINKDGEMIINTKTVSNKFSDICKENDVCFVDMTNRFLKEYQDNYIVPKGFNNTAIAYGHLNEEGHRMIADELTKVLKEMK